MKKFSALLNDGGHVNVDADRMELLDDAIRVYRGKELVAYVDVGVVLEAHMSEKVNQREL